MRVVKLRVIRLKFHITVRELAGACGLTPQWVSAFELGQRRTSERTKERLRTALETLIQRREEDSCELAATYEKHRDTLFDLVGETDYEL